MRFTHFASLNVNISLFLQFRLKFAVYIIPSSNKMRISLVSILKKGKFDDTCVHDYACLTLLDAGYRSSCHKQTVQRLIKEVKSANFSFEAGDI